MTEQQEATEHSYLAAVDRFSRALAPATTCLSATQALELHAATGDLLEQLAQRACQQSLSVVAPLLDRLEVLEQRLDALP